jgi:nucleoside-triphosphatase THEP1
MNSASPSRAPAVVLVSGGMASGKTSFCRSLASQCALRGHPAAGIVQDSVRGPDGLPMELYIRDLESGESRVLAMRKPPSQGVPPQPFDFSEETLDWALGILFAALDDGGAPIIIDEVGPLELRNGRGLRPALDRAALSLRSAGLDSPLIVTVRQSLEAELLELFGSATVLRVHGGSPDALALDLVRNLGLQA